MQTRDQDETTGSRWKEDQVLTITRCLKVDGKDKPPTTLLSTFVATMRDARALGRLARLEAEKRGIRQAVEVIGIHDGGHGIDPLWPGHFGCHQRILEDDHAAEHLHEVARAAPPSDETAARRLADGLGDHRIGREAVWQAGQGQGGVLERARGGGDFGPAEPMAQRGRGVPTLLVGVAPSAGGRINGHAPHDVLHADGDLSPATLSMDKVLWSGLTDISRPLESLFGNVKPEKVLLHRAWLNRPHSIIDYIPKAQNDPGQWTVVVRSSRFVACLLRTSMVIVAAADRVDADAIQPLLDCLPTLLRDHETRLAGIIESAVRLEARFRNDLRNTVVEIDYAASTNRMLFTARKPDGTKVPLVCVNCMRDIPFEGEAGANWIAGHRRHQQLKHTLAFFMLAKALDKETKVDDGAAYQFFYPKEHAASGDEPTAGDRKRWRDAVRLRVERAEAHLRDLLNAGEMKFIERTSSGTYVFLPQVTKVDSFTNALREALEAEWRGRHSFLAKAAAACDLMKSVGRSGARILARIVAGQGLWEAACMGVF